MFTADVTPFSSMVIPSSFASMDVLFGAFLAVE